MNKIHKERALLLSTTALFLLSLYSYMQFGLVALFGGLLIVLFFGLSLIINKPLISFFLNTMIAAAFMGQSFLNSGSSLINYDSSCLDICIGDDLPLLVIRILSVSIFVLALSLLLRRLIEKK